MRIVITAVGPDNVGLADPIIHYVTGLGANIAEIQMYDHDEEAVFAMLLRIELENAQIDELRTALTEIGVEKGLSIRVWSPDVRQRRPRLAICVTYRPEPALALLRAMRDGQIKAEPAVMIGNRDSCRGLAEQFGVEWRNIGDHEGRADDDKMIDVLDEFDVDYVILARYMRVLPASSCWKYAGGRIINLHHGILPSFPGIRPYHDAFASRMLTYGATCHFIVPELDAGNQIIHQSTFTTPPGMKLDDIIRIGQEDNEPRCLVEGVRRVVDGEVQLHFHRVIAVGS
ncbi:formyltransferase family protein [Blastopirellula marina]|uniref:Formyltetrahydrofolate deformylase n=1 Tax=Blastopirellula marina TaxID=124 RepID=A0A2S8F3Y2_9BACT|nr:formyltransferase family protein [Blastopirellula marina]PQO26827.1 formyltetrahydrofolate deformylase [Blastopirellula marina]PQO41514.1 formyltetrahydrofolate deformylase [Blastopirellula marina]PTL41034.1 formyltetrahydrofolate deformylase [Blastopirellula marina]